MPRRVKMVMIALVIFSILGIITFLLLARFYPPLNRKLFGGEISIYFDDIQFWVKKVPGRNYYRVYAKYLKSSETELPDFGHAIFFETKVRNRAHGSIIAFNPEDNKIYGGGWSGLQGNAIVQKGPSEWERVFYCLSEGKIKDGVFKPIFPKGTEFTFHPLGVLEITSAPRYYIKVYFPDGLKKLGKEELEKGVLAQIVGDVTGLKR